MGDEWATAGFAFGILEAVGKRYIGREYHSIAQKATFAVLSVVDEKGELQNTSFGTPLGV